MNKLLKSAFLVAVAMVCANANAAKESGLKDAYKKYFKIGVALNPRNITNDEQIAIVLKDFNSVTAENCMKPGELHPAPGVWNLAQADALADFCRKNGIKMRYHTLVWHSQFANWMFNKYDENGNQVVQRDEKGDTVWQERRQFGGFGGFGGRRGQQPQAANAAPVMEPVYVKATKEEFYDSLRAHIHFVLNRYKDVIYAVDVCNECMSDANDPDCAYEKSFRQSQAYQLCGDEFILKAFQFAAEVVDPKEVILMYNDYSAWTPAKRTYIYNMVKTLQEKGAPITGIGMQGHYNIYDNPTIEDFEKAIEMYSELVDNIHITELDVRVNHEAGGQLQFNRDGTEITPVIEKQFNDKYVALFEAMRRHKDVIKCVTFWNLGDRDSWLGQNNYPLPYDKEYKPKAVYYLIKDFKKKK